MQHENQAKPFLLEIQGLKPLTFGDEDHFDGEAKDINHDNWFDAAAEQEAGLKTQPEDWDDGLGNVDLIATPGPAAPGIDVWEHGYTATCDLWRMKLDEERLDDHEMDTLADLP